MMSYVSKIKAKVSIHATKKTSNVFDGSYKSVYKGNGFDFENLREYIPGDSIRDIDWKSSSRNGKLLVKNYVAEKKHNIMLVFDTGKKMCGDSLKLDCKKDVALELGGTVGFLAASNGDNVGAVYNRNGMIQYYPLRTGLGNIERILTEYDREDFSSYGSDIEKTLNYVIKNINRRMIIFIISDMSGIRSIGEDTIKRLTCQHDVLCLSISDAEITSGRSYDMGKNTYVPDFISKNKKLMKIEKETREKIYEENSRKLLKYRVVSAEIEDKEEIVDKVIDLLGRNKYAGNR